MELLVNIIDNTDNDIYRDCKLLKAGDVIWYAKDGHSWGIEEVKNPNWRIISVPDMSEDQAISLISPELPPDLDKEHKLLQLRGMKLDLIPLDTKVNGKIFADATQKEQDVAIAVIEVRNTKTKTELELQVYLKQVAVDAQITKDDINKVILIKSPYIDK